MIQIQHHKRPKPNFFNRYVVLVQRASQPMNKKTLYGEQFGLSVQAETLSFIRYQLQTQDTTFPFASSVQCLGLHPEVKIINRTSSDHSIKPSPLIASLKELKWIGI